MNAAAAGLRTSLTKKCLGDFQHIPNGRTNIPDFDIQDQNSFGRLSTPKSDSCNDRVGAAAREFLSIKRNIGAVAHAIVNLDSSTNGWEEEPLEFEQLRVTFIHDNCV